MSILIGYWTKSPDGESQSEPQRLLAIAVSGFNSEDLRLESITTRTSRSAEDSASQSPLRFAVAVYGRNTALQCARNVSLTATLAVTAATGDPDISVEASVNGLTLSRGIFGRATLFWTRIKGTVWFASQLKVLLRVIDNPSISIDGFYAYGCMSYVPAPLTPVENVFSVHAGSQLTWSAAEPEALPANLAFHYWRESDTQISDEKEASVCLRRLLEESVARQLEVRAGGPIGVFLSGGLDSSATAALLVRAGAKVRAYTLDFGSRSFSEVHHAEIVARSLGIQLTKIPVTPGSLRRMLATTASRLDGLYGDGVTAPLALLYKKASEEVEIVFNGEGGDQLFAGWTNKPLIAASLYEQSDSEDTFLAHYMRTFHRLYGDEIRVYSEPVRRQIEKSRLRAIVFQALDPAYTRSLLHRLRRANLMLKGADNIQPRATNLGLSYNLDVRTLFCSRSLAEWTFNVGGELWLKGGREKYLLKRSIEGLLPQEIIWREKRGMGVPLTLWLTGSLRRWVLRQLNPRLLAAEGLWQTDLGQRIATGELSGHVQGRRIGETLWLMLMWQAWRRVQPELKSAEAGEWRFLPSRFLPSFTRRLRGDTREVHQM
jgi:asparagine synthase (glutamine-hydrolysing)